MKEYKIKMDDIRLEDIHAVDLVLEPMEAVKVYSEEIVDVRLELDDTLVIGGSCIERKIKSGYIKLSISDKVKRYKGDINIRDENGNDIKKPYKKNIEKRLTQLCDICYIKITVKEIYWTENLDVPFEQFDICDETGLNIGYNYTVCPSAKIDKDGYLIILFGESSEFKPQAYIVEDDDVETKLTTIEDYVAFWNRQPIETLKAIAEEHGVLYDIDVNKTDLIALLRAGMEQYYKNNCAGERK